MGRLADSLGEGDQDIMALREGIAGLVFSNWSDSLISELAVEIAREERETLKEALLESSKAIAEAKSTQGEGGE